MVWIIHLILNGRYMCVGLVCVCVCACACACAGLFYSLSSLALRESFSTLCSRNRPSDSSGYFPSFYIPPLSSMATTSKAFSYIVACYVYSIYKCKTTTMFYGYYTHAYSTIVCIFIYVPAFNAHTSLCSLILWCQSVYYSGTYNVSYKHLKYLLPISLCSTNYL